MGKRIAFIIVICILITMVSTILVGHPYFFGFQSLVELFESAPQINTKPILDIFYEYNSSQLANLPVLDGIISFLSTISSLIVNLIATLVQCVLYLLYFIGSIFVVV